jgi:uncharacterized protein
MTDDDPKQRGGATDLTGPSRGTCPICSRPADAGVRPFCSKRCADVDLSRWLNGAYAIPVTDGDDDEDGDPLDGSTHEGRQRDFDHDA